MADCGVALLYAQLIMTVFSSMNEREFPGLYMLGTFIDERFDQLENTLRNLDEFRASMTELPEQQWMLRHQLVDLTDAYEPPLNISYRFSKASPLMVEILGWSSILPALGGLVWLYRQCLKALGETRDIYYGGVKAEQEREARELVLRTSRATVSAHETLMLLQQVELLENRVTEALDQRPSFVIDGMVQELSRENLLVSEVVLDVRHSKGTPSA